LNDARRDVRIDGEVVGVTQAAPRDVWRDVLAADPSAVPSQSPQRLDAVCAAGPWTDASRLYERAGGRTIVLPAVRRSWGPAAIEASLPAGWGPGGPLAPGGSGGDDVRTVVADVADLAAHRALMEGVRPAFSASRAWRSASVDGLAVVPRVVHVLDLDGGFEAVWERRFTSQTRNSLRRAARRATDAGVSIERGNSPQLVDEFYDVYLRWLDTSARRRRLPRWAVRRGGMHADPRRKFQLVAHALGDACTIYVARLDGVAAAAEFCVRQGHNAMGWRGMSDRTLTGPLRLDELLHEQSISDACAAGCRWFDMGESGGVDSLVSFKTRLGGEPCALAEYRAERVGLTAAQRWVDRGRARAESLFARTMPHRPPRTTA
jgi:hypothetical protein